MGIFEFIGNAMNSANEKCLEAENEAERKSTKQICDKIKSSASIATCAGYMAVLRNRLDEMDDYEAKELVDYLFTTKNLKAVSALYVELEDRSLVSKGSDGRYYRSY